MDSRLGFVSTGKYPEINSGCRWLTHNASSLKMQEKATISSFECSLCQTAVSQSSPIKYRLRAARLVFRVIISK